MLSDHMFSRVKHKHVLYYGVLIGQPTQISKFDWKSRAWILVKTLKRKDNMKHSRTRFLFVIDANSYALVGADFLGLQHFQFESVHSFVCLLSTSSFLAYASASAADTATR